MHVGLFNTQDNLPGDSDSIEEVVDEAHIVDESVHVTGAQHKQGGKALRNKEKTGQRQDVRCLVLQLQCLSETETGLSKGDNVEESSGESSTHSEEQSRDGRAAFHVNHGQQAGEVALSGSSKEQSVRDRDAMGKRHSAHAYTVFKSTVDPHVI